MPNMTQHTPTLLVMAGGTGGHIFPGLAVADLLREQGWKVVWLGVPNSMEATLVPQHGFEMAWVQFSGVRGKGLWRKLTLPFNLLLALWQSAQAMRCHRPDVVVGMGGYITFPGGIIAKLFGRPLVIHEQNSIAGLSNRVLARIATRVLSGFPDVLPAAEWCGNPVRSSIAALDSPPARYAARVGKLNVLVVGGSLGAQAINHAVPKALSLLQESERPEVTHQTGKAHFEIVQQLYTDSHVQADIQPFLTDMAACYAKADVVICRAGALTVAELAAAGVASILIPFPAAVDDHQTHNAWFLSQRGGAIWLPQQELTAERLAELLRELTREKLLAMAEQAHQLGKLDAAQRVAAVCTSLVRH
ncbi:MAG: undecaprenyldiphospho-muramoylpentapeptide beta-N-acetylglucosaminyltransferase [Gallionella sp.]|nr:undecaprenyldiphospho-muramoylpentapeptide beta-N-acetylglucosaminyltransferase [Gallionella sp.]